jgi:FkbM family methyltransferase
VKNKLEPKSPPEDLNELFAEIWSESDADLRRREQNTFAGTSAPFSDAIVLFGAGQLGRIVFRCLQSAGIRCLAFADNNADLWNSTVDGLEVLPPLDAVRRYGQSACFVVTVFNSAQSRKQLADMGCLRVIPFISLAWKYHALLFAALGVELPSILREQEAEIRACYSILADDSSRREFCEQLRWRYWLDYEQLSYPHESSGTYFLVPSIEDEVFVDCGAFDGDSVNAFLKFSHGRFSEIVAVEPDPGNRVALSKFIGTLPASIRGRITVFPYGLGIQNSSVGFNATTSAASRISSGGEVAIECRRLDDLPWPKTPTYIKMDIEGAEPKALLGGRALLSSSRPVLAVCVYHQGRHLWQIPNLIRSISEDYDIFLRRYAEESWEMVCYGVPRQRCETVRH